MNILGGVLTVSNLSETPALQHLRSDQVLAPPGKLVALLGWTPCVLFPFLLVGFGGMVLHISAPSTLSKDSDPGITGHPWWHLHLLSVGVSSHTQPVSV